MAVLVTVLSLRIGIGVGNGSRLLQQGCRILHGEGRLPHEGSLSGRGIVGGLLLLLLLAVHVLDDASVFKICMKIFFLTVRTELRIGTPFALAMVVHQPTFQTDYDRSRVGVKFHASWGSDGVWPGARTLI